MYDTGIVYPFLSLTELIQSDRMIPNPPGACGKKDLPIQTKTSRPSPPTPSYPIPSKSNQTKKIPVKDKTKKQNKKRQTPNTPKPNPTQPGENAEKKKEIPIAAAVPVLV